MPFLVDNDVVDLVDGVTIWGSPCYLMDVFVREEWATNHTAVIEAEVNKHFTFVIDGTTAVLPHSLFTVCVIGSNLGIQMSRYHDHIVVGPWILLVVAAPTSHACPPPLPHRWGHCIAGW